jgi:hypothetical protein
MAVPRSSIAHWTQAELQAFIQNIAKLEASSLPAAMSPNSLEAQMIRVADALDFAENSRLSQDGVIFDPISFLGSGFTGNAESMFAETVGTALWRAGGGTILAQVGDLPDFGDEYAATDQRVRGSAIYLPARAEVSSLHCYISSIPSAFNGSYNAIALFSTSGGGSSPTLTLIENVNGIGTTITSSTGFKTFALASSHVLEAGIYYVAVLTHWSSITGTLGFAARNATRAAQNDSQLSGPMRVVSLDAQTTMPSSWTPGSAQISRPWFGLS